MNDHSLFVKRLSTAVERMERQSDYLTDIDVVRCPDKGKYGIFARDTRV